MASAGLCMFSWCFAFFVSRGFAISCRSPASPAAIDIRDSVGVRTEKLAGSRVEYLPFPVGYKINPGHSLEFEFRTSSSSGLIFLAGDFDRAHMVSAYVRRGHVTFARRCGGGRAFEIYQDRRLDDNEWHKLTYYHGENGGILLADGVNAFRHYHLGPCVSFSSVIFGGIAAQIAPGANLSHVVDGQAYTRESDLTARHRFNGCLRNLRFDGKVPAIHPRYFAVSQCEI